MTVDEWDDANPNPMLGEAKKTTEGNGPLGIDNTTRRMKDPLYRALMFDGTSNPGGRPGMIEQQEKDGQRQLVNSDRLPVRLNGRQLPGEAQAAYEALGFTFGDPDPDDPLFRPATLPEGWKREGSDHAMWSYLVDQHGRRRVAIFFKAAWYDRDAFMSLETLWAYVRQHVEDGEPLLIDADWATRDAVIAAMREHVAENRKDIADYRGYAADPGRDEDNRRYFTGRIPEAEATAAKYEAAIAALEAGQT